MKERKNPRLTRFDYSTPGGYFITICTKDRKMLLSSVVGAGHPAPTTVNISKIISALKSLSSREAGHSLWQRSCYDHIIRNEDDYLCIRTYIETNPARWAEDKYYIAQES